MILELIKLKVTLNMFYDSYGDTIRLAQHTIINYVNDEVLFQNKLRK